MVETLEGYITPARAAHRIGIAPLTLKQWAKRGRIPALLTPLGLVFRTEDVERVAREREELAKEVINVA